MLSGNKPSAAPEVRGQGLNRKYNLYRYGWGNNEVCKAWMGAVVRVLAVGRKQTALIERIGDGARMTTSLRALRRIK